MSALDQIEWMRVYAHYREEAFVQWWNFVMSGTPTWERDFYMHPEAARIAEANGKARIFGMFIKPRPAQ